MFTIFNAEQGSDLRALIRLVTVGFTAFGLKLHVDQIALIQAALEATLQLFVKSPLGSSSSSPDAPTPGRGADSTSAVPTAVTGSGVLPSVTASDAGTLLPTIATGNTSAGVVDNGIGYIAPESGEL